MRNPFFIAVLLVLTACWTKPIFPNYVIHEKLNLLNGQQVDAAIQKLGKPVGQEKEVNAATYTWMTSKTGQVPKWRAFMSDPAAYKSDQPTLEQLNCTLEIFVDEDDKITGHDLRGDADACAIFASRLDPSYKYTPPL